MSTPGTELANTAESKALVPQPSDEFCTNCGAPIYGKFCVSCGQRVEHHVHSLAEFLGEAAEVITHADSRVWRTFQPLLFRPGFLTQQYLAGRRASYLPPFRLYIVLSVVFFLMVSLATRTTHVKVETPAQGRAEIQKEIDASTDPEEKANLAKTLATVDALNSKMAATKEGTNCTPKSDDAVPGWLLKHPQLFSRMIRACEKATADNGQELFSSVIHNAGRAMFIFLPAIAVLMKLLYWRPRRYYVEHLLLLLHNHAFIFLSVSLLLAVQLIVPTKKVNDWLFIALWLYGLWYMYRSMRRVYEQGRALTVVKFFVLACAYFFLSVLTLVFTAVYSAATL